MSLRPLRSLQAVLFDLDGTLVDTAADLVEAVNRIVSEEGGKPVPEALLRPLVSKGSRTLLAHALPTTSEEARDRLVPRFLAAYAAGLTRHSRPYPGIEELLTGIEAHAWRWGIVTNKPEALARGVVEGMGWSQRCAVLVGGDTLAVRKPHPAPLLRAAELLGVDPAACLYIGDDARDIEASNAAGMPCLAALWGYREAHEQPEHWPATAHCQAPADCADWLWDESHLDAAS